MKTEVDDPPILRCRWSLELCVIALTCLLLCQSARAQNRNHNESTWAHNRIDECADDDPPKIAFPGGLLGPDYDTHGIQCPPVASGPTVTGLVSARTLAHKPVKAAAKEFDRGVQAWHKGQTKEALRHLSEAVRLDPGFVQAHGEIGALYAKIGQPELALDCFDRALTLDPNWAVLHSDKAATLVILNRPKEAEPEARRAIQLDSGLNEAHYMLGVSLLMQKKLTPEVVTHLTLAADKYPQATVYLIKVREELAKSQLPQSQ